MRHLPFFLLCILPLAVSGPAFAQQAGDATLFDTGLVRTALILTLLAVVPTILISMTSFIRIVIVLGMIRHAFGMPETPPNPVLISLALFLTAFTMGSTFSAVQKNAVQPYLNEEISLETALEEGAGPLKEFMLSQVRDEDLQTIYAIADAPLPTTPGEVDIWKLTPAFILNELRIAFSIGFLVMLPFLLIDLVVSSVLLSLGMMMVPPSTIALPIKLLMFIVIDGWSLVMQGVLSGFL